MSSTTTFSDFLSAVDAGDAVVAIAGPSVALPSGARRVSGAVMTNLDGLYDEFTRAWDFPSYFGRNKDAFDDCMRDLSGSPLITVITDAQELLTDGSRNLRWFAESLVFYRDHYLDEDPRRTFAVVLRVEGKQVAAVRRRWRALDIAPLTLGS